MAYTFPPEQFPSVRAAVGLDMDEQLTDEILSLDIYTKATERYIERSLTEAQYTNSDWVATVDMAATLYMASLAAPRLRPVIAEKIAGGNITYNAVNLEVIAEKLNGQAGQLISDIQIALAGTSSVRNPHFFGTVGPRCSY